MRRIDAHQHFWKLSRGDYGWLTPELSAIYRDFLPDDLKPLMEAEGIDGTVLVQAAPSDAETDFMLSLADENAFIRGVVGWVDFESPDAPARIAELAAHPRFKGLRPMIQDIPDPDWMLRPQLNAAFRALIDHGLVFDALVLPRHLKNLAVLVDRYPEMTVVIDHCAKPDIASGAMENWAEDMASLAKRQQVSCKLSGLVTEAGEGWDREKLQPYADHVLTVFGPGRVIWGSDWPVCTLAASYSDWCEATAALLQRFDAADWEAILGANAGRIYGLS
ncbi:amidohydrolase 2 [Nitratireductor aquibiodomus RA22]|uniref:Amidohydrolase 2 n=1 Tax=Nitratireductor aquibiodomus RA22 TaxID=1189611 RepID=I5C6L2_9HYPH|nr:amidohydrolase family protein [Nitratireductor aquibiodomus]EIM77464.1 amidohydrolase 2 [Nitratireductor aquibiodomus RA22]